MNKTLIVIPTTGAPELMLAVQSALLQTEPTDVLVVVDGAQFATKTMDALKACGALSLGDNAGRRVDVLVLPYNTGAEGFYAHRIIAGVAHLVNHEYVCFLDQDNWLKDTHVASCQETIKEGDYKFVHALRGIWTKDQVFVCNDNCESLGSWHTWNDRDGHLIDTSCYFYRTDFLQHVAHFWHTGYGGDRQFLAHVRNLQEQYHGLTYGCTGEYTVCYRLGGNPNSVRAEFFVHGNAMMARKWPQGFPWAKSSSLESTASGSGQGEPAPDSPPS